MRVSWVAGSPWWAGRRTKVAVASWVPLGGTGIRRLTGRSPGSEMVNLRWTSVASPTLRSKVTDWILAAQAAPTPSTTVSIGSGGASVALPQWPSATSRESPSRVRPGRRARRIGPE